MARPAGETAGSSGSPAGKKGRLPASLASRQMTHRERETLPGDQGQVQNRFPHLAISSILISTEASFPA